MIIKSKKWLKALHITFRRKKKCINLHTLKHIEHMDSITAADYTYQFIYTLNHLYILICFDK